MTKINVSNLKAHLSAVLAKIRLGHEYTVLDRHTPIAIIKSLSASNNFTPSQQALVPFELPKSPINRILPDPLEDLLEDRSKR